MARNIWMRFATCVVVFWFIVQQLTTDNTQRIRSRCHYDDQRSICANEVWNQKAKQIKGRVMNLG